MVALKSLNRYFWKYRHLFLLGSLFVIGSNYFRILSPQLTGFIVNTVAQKVQNAEKVTHHTGMHVSAINRFLENQFNQMSFTDSILYSGLALLLMALISGFFMFLMRQTIIVMSRHIEFDQKNDIYRQYQQLDMGFFRKNAIGDLMSRISEDVGRVRMYTGPTVMYVINLFAVIGFSIYFMLRSDPTLTLFALAPLPVLAITIYYVNAVINRKSEVIQTQLSRLTSLAQESYSGIRVIKSFTQENSMEYHFLHKSEAYRKASMSLAATESIYFPSMSFLIGLSTLITVGAGGWQVLNGVPGASIGRIAEFVLYIQMLTFPVSAIGLTVSMIQRAAASQKRIDEFLQLQPNISDAPAAIAPLLHGNIIFKEVSFTYNNTGIQAIKHFNLTIRNGDKVAIVGKTGSGKTTIAQLLLRFFEVDSGELYLEEFPVNHIQLKSLRGQISYVPQDVFLYSDSLLNNIRFGNPDASMEEVVIAAQTAGIHDEIMQMPQQYLTEIGERGIAISGGQKQRIAIARALLKNAPIILFDDSLSAIDAKTEQLILQQLKNEWRNKTVIMITHRILSLQQFDKIVVMDEGKIVEEGTHEELLNKNGTFAALLKRQQEADYQ